MNPTGPAPVAYEQALRQAFGVDDLVVVPVALPDGTDGRVVVLVDTAPAASLIPGHEQARALLGAEAPVAFATVPSMPGGHPGRANLVARMASGELPLSAASGRAVLDYGPRAVPGVDGVRTIRLPLLGYARGSVNAYLLDTDTGPVLVDTGFSATAPELVAALAVAGVRRGELAAIVCTHNHADHLGAAMHLVRDGWLARDGDVIMHERTHRFGRAMFVEDDGSFERQLRANGVPGGEIPRWRSDMDAMIRLADFPTSRVRTVADQERVQLGDLALEVCFTPGHSPDHMALIARRATGPEIALVGDLSLGERMPPYGMRDTVSTDPLGDLMRSWDHLLARTSGSGLPGHGPVIPDLGALHGLVTAAYDARVAEFRARWTGAVVSAADIARPSGTPQDGFGPRQFAFYGALAMLRHLVQLGAAALVDTGPDRYRVQR